MPDPRFESETPFSEDDLRKIEAAVGRSLPAGYREFVKKHGGCFVGGMVDGSEDLPILAFFGPDQKKGVLSKLATHGDLKGDSILPFADCELGNLYVLDRENKVHYINYYGGKTTAKKVSDSFSDFVERIVVEEE